MARQDSNPGDGGSNAGMSMMLMMALMMGMCFGTVLLFSLIPLAGWPVAIAAALVGLAGMVFLHQRLMGHNRH